MTKTDPESLACTPVPLDPQGFNYDAELPFGLTVDHVRQAMESFLDFLGFVNSQLHSRDIPRLESMLMAANFSSMVGEFMTSNIPKYCQSLVKNRFHNGHPDLIPRGRFPGDAVQYAHEGVEVKASRYERGWQGHNPEPIFLMVFVFDSNGPRDEFRNVPPKPFRFRMVVAAQLEERDWKFAGRSGRSRRTITASVTRSGFDKMIRNWVYMEHDLREKLLE